MKTLLRTILSCALVIVVETSFAGSPQPPPIAELPQPPPPASPPQRLPVADDLSAVLQPRVPTSSEVDKEITGLSRTSQPVLLTWERIYALALVRARSGHGAISETIDPAALTEEAARQGVADFARFRKDFLAEAVGGSERFRDPSAAVLRLLSRLQSIENARRNCAIQENLMKLLAELVQGEARGLQQLDIDMVFASLVRTRQSMSNEIRQFRDGLDDLKVSLGLSPRAAVILDRQSYAAFRAVFDSVDDWARKPDRSLAQLPLLIDRLPALADFVVDGQPILSKNPDLSEEILTRAGQIAVKNQSARDKNQPTANSTVQLEIPVRHRLRNLFETASAYESEKRLYQLAVRIRDQSFERLLAPSVGSIPSRSPLLGGLIEQINQVLNAENRLFTLWTSFRSERLALYHHLGVLPHQDWASFYADLSTGPVAAKPVPAVAPGPAAVNTGPPPVPPRP